MEMHYPLGTELGEPIARLSWGHFSRWAYCWPQWKLRRTSHKWHPHWGEWTLAQRPISCLTLSINVSAVLDKNCRAGENRSQISRIWDVPSPASLSPTCFPAHPLPNCLPQEQEWQWGHNAILLICDLFSPALQLLSTTALTLFSTHKYVIKCCLF